MRSAVARRRTYAPLADAVAQAVDVAVRTQGEDGAWPGDYGGPMFLLPIYVLTAEIVEAPLDATTRAEMRRYLLGKQNADGGWGLHVEGPSMTFSGVLVYSALRALGVGADTRAMVRARTWLHRQGGLSHAAPWAKMILAMAGVYDWRGVDPLPPEIWLLPRSLPIHPWRFWCHSRMIFLPLSVLYGLKASQPIAVADALRRELFVEPPAALDWGASRNWIAPSDNLVRVHPAMQVFNRVLHAYEARAPRRLRRKAVAHLMDHIRAEDESTNYICIGPVNKLLNTLCWHFTKPGGPEVAAHIRRMPDYLWWADDGVKMNGYNSSKLWDTTFMAQALAATGDRRTESRDALRRALDYVDRNQVLHDVPNHKRYYRHRSRGGWPFSNRDHGWPITDCTAEGIKTALAVEQAEGLALEPWRLNAAAELILSWQNRDGGWATYELTRGPKWLEALNVTRVFSDIMIDYSYVECTSASLQALTAWRPRAPRRLRRRMDVAIARGARFIRGQQQDDGAWRGSWGICYTYGTWFGVWGLRAAGAKPDDPALRRAVRFLLAHQLSDGGWGEAPTSTMGSYVHAEQGQAVMTGWALLALLATHAAADPAVTRGVRFLQARQQDDGRWPPEHIAGVFNQTCAIHYDNYLKIFPMWALARARAAGLAD